MTRKVFCVLLALVLALSVGLVACGGGEEEEEEEEVDEFPESMAKVYLIAPSGQELTIDLTGPTTVHVLFEGPVEGEARDNDGDGLDEVSTEIVDMELTGDSPLGPVEVHLNPDIRSTGEVEEITNNTPGVLDLPPFTTEGIAKSYFDVYFELVMGGFVFRTNEPKRMKTFIRHKPPQEGDTYQNLDMIPLVDLDGLPTGFFVGKVLHTPVPPPPEVDEFPESVAKVFLIAPSGQESTIDLTGPTTVQVFFEGAEGEASDNDGDGLDEVSTMMVDMELTGNSPLGPVEVHLNPDIPSIGEVEEITNNTPGVLDLPPFTTEGTANSYFDVYFELVMAEFVFRTNEPKRMVRVISHKPPGEGDTYENLDKIPLVDLDGLPTGFFVGKTFHTPVPHEEPLDGSIEFETWTINGDPVPPGEYEVGPGTIIDVRYKEHVTGKPGELVSVNQTCGLDFRYIQGEKPETWVHAVNADGAVSTNPAATKSYQITRADGVEAPYCTDITVDYAGVFLTVEVGSELEVCTNYTKTINWLHYPDVNDAPTLFEIRQLEQQCFFEMRSSACIKVEGDVDPTNDCSGFSPPLTIIVQPF